MHFVQNVNCTAIAGHAEIEIQVLPISKLAY